MKITPKLERTTPQTRRDFKINLKFITIRAITYIMAISSLLKKFFYLILIKNLNILTI